MNEKNYIERYWRDAKPEDAIVEAGWWWDDDKQELQLVNFDNSDGFHASGVHVETFASIGSFVTPKSQSARR